MERGSNTLYFSSVNWNWIKQRPHFIAEYLVKQGARVTYLSLRHAYDRMVCFQENGVDVLEPFTLRGYMRTPVLRMANRCLLSQAIKGRRYSSVILTNPIQLELLPRMLRDLPLFYDCMDMIVEFYDGQQQRTIQRDEYLLCQKAKSIFVSCKQIGSYLSRAYDIPDTKFVTVNNAYSPETVADISAAPLKTPNLVYVGTMGRWLDIAVLTQFSQANPEYTLYLVGPAERDIQRRLKTELPNCVLTGPLPHRQAMSYIQGASVVMVPFLRSKLIDVVDPVKNYEYIALRKPVVTSEWPALEHFKQYENMHFYQDAASFERQVLACTGKTYQIPVCFEQENGWDARAAQIAYILNRYEES